MSGIVSGINYNLLFGGESSSDATAAILTALYSGTSSTTPTTTFVSSGNPITDLKLAQSEQTTGVTREAQQPLVADAITEQRGSSITAIGSSNHRPVRLWGECSMHWGS